MARQTEKKKFDWDKFRQGRVAVHLQTVAEARKFNEILHNHGIRWCCDKEQSDEFCEQWIGRLCFHVNEMSGYLLYDRIGYINQCGYEICMFSKYDFGEETT